MRILITGGFGYLGLWLADYFYKKKYEICILSKRIKNNPIKIPCKIIEADITNLKQLKSELKDKYDYCLHTASINDQFIKNYDKKALLVNALGTRNIIEALNECNKLNRFIYFSTFHVYGKYNGIINENMKFNPYSDYASTHLFAEYYLKQFYNLYKFPYTTVRLTNCYGAPKHINSTKWYLVLNDLAKMAYEQGEIVLNSNGTVRRDFIWIGDVCSIVHKLLKAKNTINDSFLVSSEKTLIMNDIAEIVKKVYEKRYNKKVRIYVNKDDRTVYDANVFVSNKKLKSVIKFNIHDNLYNEVNEIFSLLEKNVE
ncbi:MAG: NAD(P)-dependent oxidoreductase [Candidatus Ancaeobacter aquaticus]|nr:NAD(P)-dependent oxidoreductase [Candidatus Ancaeobacter aquaticus]